MSGLYELPDPLSASLPLVQMYDAQETGIAFNVITIPTASRISGPLELTGYRRFRLKWRIDDGGNNATAVNVRLLNQSYNRAATWENVLFAGIPFGVNGANVLNFGEGTGVMEAQGVWFRFLIQNAGPFNMFIRDVELWCGG